MSVPRIAPGGLRDVGLFAWGFSRISGRVTGTNPPNLFLTLGRAPGLFRGWLHFAGRMMPGGKLPRRETEMVILRVAHTRGCDYEFEHHLRLGKRAGIGPVEVERITAGPMAEGWSPRERAILAAVDELHDKQDLADATWTELRVHLSEREVVELLMLAGHYEMLATFILTLRIVPDSHR